MLPSASTSCFTFAAAVSVTVITTVLLAELELFARRSRSGRLLSVPDTDRHIARVTISQRAKTLDNSRSGCFHHPFDDASVEVADEIGVGLGQLPKRAVQEIDPDPAVLAWLELRLDGIEAEPVELADQSGETAAAPLAPGHSLLTPAPAHSGGIDTVGAELVGEGGEEPGEERVGRRGEAEAGGARGPRGTPLGAGDGAPGGRLGLRQP